ncbi:MAG: hypothetical protein JOY58_10750 [Solirubrobacterales bacterium]|nr:hypothetical protein [Solirubrobacterales bacterium]
MRVRVQFALESGPCHIRVGYELRGGQQLRGAFRVVGDLRSPSAAARTVSHVVGHSVRNGQGLVVEPP